MATQRISLDPKLWAKTRRTAFDMGVTATEVVSQALVEYLDRAENPLAGLAAAPKTLKHDDRPIGRITKVTEDESGITVEGEVWPKDDPRRDVKLMEVSVTSDKLPWDSAVALVKSGQAAVLQGNSSVVPDAVIPAIEQRIRGEAVIAQDALPPPAVIKDPKEAAAKVQAAMETRNAQPYHPVPKPTSTKKPRR
jgi:gamma-glutamyl phosphate reductase